MSFANPYNFVVVKNEVDRKDFEKIKHHTKIIHEESFSGIITCQLKTLTKLFIPSTIEKDITEEIIGNVRNNRPVKHIIFNSFYYYLEKKDDIKKIYAIPASSLKGVIRSVAEAVSDSCLHMFDGSYEHDTIRYAIGDKLKKDNCIFYDEKGNLGNGLCICCSMFGMANARDSEETKKEKSKTPNVFKGKIRFSDARLTTSPSFEGTFPLKELSSPKPHHGEFYADGKFIRGRKFYYHHKDQGIQELQGKKTKRNRSITPLKKDAIFEFTISFENLTAQEYGLLLTTLELEQGFGHKIGMGKPLGLGSCVIEVTEIKEYSKNRYLDITANAQVFSRENGNLQAKKDGIKEFWEKGIPEDLRCILNLTPGFTEIRYPKKDIHNPANDEFKIYKKLHDPCREFSDDDKKGPSPVFKSERKSSERPDRPQPKGGCVMADAFRKTNKKKM